MENDATLEKNKKYSTIATRYANAIINTALKEQHVDKGIFSEAVVRKYANKEKQVEIER